MISMNPFYVYAPRGGMVGYRQMTTGEHTVAQQVNSKVSLSLPLIFSFTFFRSVMRSPDNFSQVSLFRFKILSLLSYSY